MLIAGTGHRPNKLGGYSPQVFTRLTDLARASLIRFAPDKVISGMALGWDTALALAALELNIPLTAAVPFAGQELRWSSSDKSRYHDILSRCSRVVIVCSGGYSATKMMTRNEWMVDRCDRVLAIWDGSSGGTGNCIDYAIQQHRPISNVWDSWVKYRGL